MKNAIKYFGIIALVAVIGFSMAGCDLGDKINDANLVLSWKEGSLADEDSEVWYTVNVTSGTTYYVWVKEYWSSSVVVADGYASVYTSAYYGSQTGTAIFENSGAGANNSTAAGSSWPASNFTADQTGTVHIKISYGGLGHSSGKFKVAVTTINIRPSGE